SAALREDGGSERNVLPGHNPLRGSRNRRLGSNSIRARPTKSDRLRAVGRIIGKRQCAGIGANGNRRIGYVDVAMRAGLYSRSAVIYWQSVLPVYRDVRNREF